MDTDNAIDAFQTVLKLKPETVSAQNKLANLFLIKGNLAAATEFSGQVVKAMNRKDIIIAGHDWLPQTLDLIDQGWIPWSVGEAPYDNCFKAVEWLAQAVRGTKPIPRGPFITKTILATKENLAEIRKSPNASG